jgi:RNase P/RNase MRP subunit p30
MQKKTIQGRDIAFNRKMLESKETGMLILRHKPRKERLKQRESGLNQVLCKIARDNNIILAFDMQELAEEHDKKTKAEILSRMLQNIKLIKKFKNKFKLLNPGNKHQAFSFLLTLGLPTNQAKQATENVE